MNIAIILAGGVGSRVGADVPKQFIDIYGRPVLAYTIEKFQNHPQVDAIEIVCIKSYKERMHDFVQREGFDKVRWVAKGGETFQESVINGLNHISEDVDGEDNILIHYGASPFVSEDIISDAIRVCDLHGNASPANSLVYLAASRGDGEKSTEFIDRDQVMCLNSPQAVKYDYAQWLYAEARKRNLLEKVDPHTTSLMLAMGEPVYFSKNSTSNIKITTADDVRLFKGYVLAHKIAELGEDAINDICNSFGNSK